MSCPLSTGLVISLTLFCDPSKPYDFSSNLLAPETIAESTEVPHLAMTATKWTLEWTKMTLCECQVSYYYKAFMPVCRVPDDPDLHLAGFVTRCDHPGHLPQPRICQPHPPLLPQPGEHGAYTETSIPASYQVLNPRSIYQMKFRT